MYLILALLLFTALNLAGAVASRNANTNLVALVSQLASFVIPAIVILPALAKQNIQSQRFGLLMAVATGLLVGAYAVVVSKAFTQTKIAVITPVIFGGAILLTTIWSYLVFKEKISPVEGIGLACVLVGIVVIIYARAVTV